MEKQQRARLENLVRDEVFFQLRDREEAAKRAAAAPLPVAQQNEVMLAAYTALDAFTRGEYADDEHWHTLACELNYTLVLCEMDVGESRQHIEVSHRALTALVAAQDRHKNAGRWGFTGDQLQHMRDALDLHKQQLEIATRAELAEVRATIRRRIKAGDFHKPQQEATAV